MNHFYIQWFVWKKEGIIQLFHGLSSANKCTDEWNLRVRHLEAKSKQNNPLGHGSALGIGHISGRLEQHAGGAPCPSLSAAATCFCLCSKNRANLLYNCPDALRTFFFTEASNSCWRRAFWSAIYTTHWLWRMQVQKIIFMVSVILLFVLFLLFV